MGNALLIGMKKTELDGYSNVATRYSSYNVSRIKKILKKENFSTIKVLESPKGNLILKELKAQVDNLKNDDFLVVYYFGHGGQKQDINGDEDDGEDETLVALDREILDDEIYEILVGTNKTSRVFFVIDACNSGSSIKLLNDKYHKGILEKKITPTLDIIYLGATSDGTKVPANAFTKIIYKEWSKLKSNEGYIDFFKKVEAKMNQNHDIFPVLDLSMSKDVKYQKKPPFKI
tara:strand:+ start:395 stop:1090 length:696 start_codon:yes stop_codon:yes gene_type:complete